MQTPLCDLDKLLSEYESYTCIKISKINGNPESFHWRELINFGGQKGVEFLLKKKLPSDLYISCLFPSFFKRS